MSDKQAISYINQFSESSVGFGNLRRCGTLFYPSAVRCGAVQGFSNGLWKTSKKIRSFIQCTPTTRQRINTSDDIACVAGILTR